MPAPTSTGPASGPPAPATAAGLQAARKAQALHDTDLPRLRGLRDRATTEADAWCGAALALALKAHAAAAGALRFDLLVAPGLRAGPSRLQQEAFRRQVEDVTTCTEVTWLLVRDAAPPDAGEIMDPAAMDFVMGSRALQRDAALASQAIARLHDALASGPGGAGSDAVLERLAAAAGLLEPVARACSGAQRAQMAAWRCADLQRDLDRSLKDVAKLLRGGLLARLGELLEPGSLPGAGELAQAAQARDALVARLEEAARCVEALRAARDGLLAALEAMEA